MCCMQYVSFSFCLRFLMKAKPRPIEPSVPYARKRRKVRQLDQCQKEQIIWHKISHISTNFRIWKLAWLYQANWLKRLENQCTKESRVVDEDSSPAWIKAFAFNKAVDHIYDHNAESPGIIFSVKHLEKIHVDKLESYDIYIIFHVKRFSPDLKIRSMV